MLHTKLYPFCLNEHFNEDSAGEGDKAGGEGQLLTGPAPYQAQTLLYVLS